MLTQDIQAALRHAHYEMWPEDGTFVGTIPGFQGVWSKAKTLEECRAELQEVLEDWMLVGLRHSHTLPVVAEIDLNVRDVT